MASRSARKARAQRPQSRGPRQPAVPKGTVSYSTEQLASILAAQQQAQLATGRTTAEPLPTSAFWESAPFGPGMRLKPAPINIVRPDTQRAEPRLWEFPVSWNLQIDDTYHVPWKTLQDAASIPLFRKCIERRKSICQLDYAVTVDPRAIARESAITGQSDKDIESAIRKKYTSEISRVTDWLAMPDRKNGLDWAGWGALLMENRLKFDAACVYPRRTFGGDLFALEVIDGKTIKPLLDEYGGRPLPPYPAYQQILYGFPRGEFTADTVDVDGQTMVAPGFTPDQLLYKRSVYRSESPYGLSATEIALLDGMLWMRRFGWMLAEYTQGVMPASFLKTDGTTDWTVEQWEDFQSLLNDHLSGNTAERHRFPLMPPGVEPVQAATIEERYRPDYDLLLIKLVAGDFGLPASEVGFTESGALGASYHEGEEDILNRQTRVPDSKWLAGIATELAVRQLGMPADLIVTILGLESEDEAAADAVASDRIGRGCLTRNEDRARMGLPALQFDEADMVTLDTGRGIVFLEGASKLAPPGTLIGPAMLPPGGQEPPIPGQDPAKPPAKPADSEDEDQPPRPPVAKAAEARALRRWLAKGGHGRPFECAELTEADAQAAGIDPGGASVVFKDSPGPKALAGTGPAGRGTLTS